MSTSTNMYTILSIVLSLSLLLTKLFFSSSSKKKYYNHPPSPLSLPILGHLHLLKRPRHRCLSGLHDLYGPLLLLRFGLRRVLLVSSLPLAEECLTKNDTAFAGRPRLHSGRHLSNGYTTIISSPYGSHWRNLRRIATIEILSTARLVSFSSTRAYEVKSLVQRLYNKSSKGFEKVEMTERLFGLVLNVMMGTIAGKRYYGGNAAGMEEARRFKEIVDEGLRLMAMSTLGDFVPGLWWADFKGLERKLVALKKRRDVFLQALIEEERNKLCGDLDVVEEEKEKKTLIKVLLSLQKEDPGYYTDDMIRGFMSVRIA